MERLDGHDHVVGRLLRRLCPMHPFFAGFANTGSYDLLAERVCGVSFGRHDVLQKFGVVRAYGLFSALDDGEMFLALTSKTLVRASERQMPMNATQIEGPEMKGAGKYKVIRVTGDGAELEYNGNIDPGADSDEDHKIVMRNNSYDAVVVWLAFTFLLTLNAYGLHRLAVTPFRKLEPTAIKVTKQPPTVVPVIGGGAPDADDDVNTSLATGGSGWW